METHHMYVEEFCYCTPSVRYKFTMISEFCIALHLCASKRIFISSRSIRALGDHYHHQGGANPHPDYTISTFYPYHGSRSYSPSNMGW